MEEPKRKEIRFLHLDNELYQAIKKLGNAIGGPDLRRPSDRRVKEVRGPEVRGTEVRGSDDGVEGVSARSCSELIRNNRSDGIIGVTSGDMWDDVG